MLGAPVNTVQCIIYVVIMSLTHEVNGMNLQQLDHLLALAETGSFSRASERVHLTQPALSRSIQMLEQELGMPVIDRVGKRNELTPFGAMVMARAKRISMEVHELKRTAALLADGEAGVVRLGLGGASSALFSAPLLTQMLRNHPKVSLQIRSGAADVQLAALRARALDAVVLTYRAVLPREDLHIELLPTMRSGFICRGGHPTQSKGRRAMRFEDLVQYPLISSNVSDDVARILVECYGANANPQHWLHIASDEIGALIAAVQRSDAIFLGMLASARELLAEGALVELELKPDAGLSVQLAFITLEGRTEPPALKLVRDFCLELAQAEEAASRKQKILGN